MSLLRKKCGYCKKKIGKGKEFFKEVKIPAFIGTRKKAFCCQEHANDYEKEVEECLKKHNKGGSCCE